ncbi:protein of unknown function [Methylacidimicrobium sp. AP8]|nr:protein of unknown function [Methylacidimicrobium sp. AP8]
MTSWATCMRSSFRCVPGFTGSDPPGTAPRRRSKRSMSKRPVFTYQTRLRLTHEQTSCLDAYAALYGRAQRTLLARMRAGVPINELKRSFLRRFGLTARQFNAIRVELEGKIASIRERRPELIEEAKWRIRKAEEAVGRLEKKHPGSNVVHQKKAAACRPAAEARGASGRSGVRPGPALFRFPTPLPQAVCPGRERLCGPCRMEEGLAGGAEQPVLRARIEGRGLGQPVLPSRSRSGRQPAAAVAAAERMGKHEQTPGARGRALGLRPGGNPPGPLRRPGRDRTNQDGEALPQAGGSCRKLPLRAGPEGVAGIRKRRGATGCPGDTPPCRSDRR